MCNCIYNLTEIFQEKTSTKANFKFQPFCFYHSWCQLLRTEFYGRGICESEWERWGQHFETYSCSQHTPYLVNLSTWEQTKWEIISKCTVTWSCTYFSINLNARPYKAKNECWNFCQRSFMAGFLCSPDLWVFFLVITFVSVWTIFSLVFLLLFSLY